ncbi:MAG: hypothetical protein ACXWUR_06575 [Allosphingosinicella sp.]
MGLSSSKSKTTTSTSQNSNETSSGTQMPVTPAWLEQAAMDYVGRIGAFGDADPNRFVAPAAPLQQMAWNNAGRLSDWQGQARTAAEMARAAGGRGPHFAGPAALAEATGYQPPAPGEAALVSGAGYAAPGLGSAAGYAAARAGAPIGAASQAYAPFAAERVAITPAAEAAATRADAASLLDHLPAYRSPYEQQVVDASLAQYDRGAAEQQARLAAQGARSAAFGGSRFGLAEGQLAADFALGRGAAAAGLHDQAFRTAAELARADAANRQQASLFNAGNATSVGLANAEAANRRALAQAGFDQETGLQGAAARNEAARFGAAATNQTSLANAEAANRFALALAEREDAAARHGVDAANQFALAQAGLQADAARFGAGAANQAVLANAGARNQFALAAADLAAQAGQFGAAARNQASLFNAGARNDVARFDAGQADAAAQRGLAAAQLLGSLAGDYGAATRADLQTLAALGEQQRGIEQGYAMAPLAQLEAIGRLSGMTPYDILVGRSVAGSSSGATTGTGTSVTTQSPSLFSQLLAAGNMAAGFL